MSFVTLIYIWASIQSFLLGAGILMFKRNIANLFLVAFLVITSTNIAFQYILIYTDFRDAYPEYVFVSDTIGFLYGPVLYLYYQQMIYQTLSKKALLHFIPAFCYTAYFFIVEMYLKMPFEFDNYIGQPAHVITLNLILLSSIIYFMLCLIAIRRVRNGSKITEFRLIFWLEVLLVILILKTVFNVVTFSLHSGIDLEVDELISAIKNAIFAISNMVIIIAIQFFFIRYPHIINKEAGLDEDQEEESEEDSVSKSDEISGAEAENTDKSDDKKEGFSISSDDAQEYLQALDNLMETEKLYLDSGLTEKGLAEALDMQPYFLSKLLNQHLGKRFNEYINEYRVENAKKLLVIVNAKSYTMFAISIDSGFKSESVFYNNFKKFTGYTPKAYQVKFLKDN